MKKLLTLLTLLSVVSFSFAQESSGGNVITSGDNLISVGANLDDWSNIIPGVSVAWDHGVGFAKSFTFGAQANANFDGGLYLQPLFRAGYHPFAMPVLQGKIRIAPVFDPYVVVAVGPSLWFGDGGDVFDGVKVKSAVGCHWMFSKALGLWGEVGSHFTAGVTFKL